MQLGITTRLTRLSASADPPAFALNFMQSSLDPRLTFSRASAGTDFVNGALQSALTDAPRLSAANGLLIEEGRTNSLRNTGSGGATVGVLGAAGALPTNWTVEVPAGLTTEIISAGAVNGFAATRLRISGTPTAASWQLRFESNAQVGASLGQAWSGSLFARLQAGALTNIAGLDLRVVEVNGSGTYLAGADSPFTPAIGFERFLVTRTTADAAVAAVNLRLRLNLSIGQAIDVTLDLAAPQLELGAFATSYIATNGAAATRAADVCTVGTAGWYNAPEGTFFAEAKTSYGLDPASSNSPRVFRAEASSSIGHDVRRIGSDASIRAVTQTAGVTQASLSGGTWGDQAVGRVAHAYKNNDMAFCYAGGTVAVDTATAEGMPAATSLRLGSGPGNSNFFNGWVRRFSYWNRRLPNEQLKTLSQ